MSPFIAAVLDTLLPGEADAPEALPSGSRAPIDFADLTTAHADALRAIATEAGGEAVFVAASPDKRADAIRRVEATAPFQALLAAVLMRYYQSDKVTTAMGWRLEAPQPHGHKVAATDDATWERLERVEARGRIWR